MAITARELIARQSLARQTTNQRVQTLLNRPVRLSGSSSGQNRIQSRTSSVRTAFARNIIRPSNLIGSFARWTSLARPTIELTAPAIGPGGGSGLGRAVGNLYRGTKTVIGRMASNPFSFPSFSAFAKSRAGWVLQGAGIPLGWSLATGQSINVRDLARSALGTAVSPLGGIFGTAYREFGQGGQSLLNAAQNLTNPLTNLNVPNITSPGPLTTNNYFNLSGEGLPQSLPASPGFSYSDAGTSLSPSISVGGGGGGDFGLASALLLGAGGLLGGYALGRRKRRRKRRTKKYKKKSSR